MREMPSRPSMRGYWLPVVTTAAAVIGTKEAERIRSNAQWYDPCVLEGVGKVVGSFTVPFRIATRNTSSGYSAKHPAVSNQNLRPPGTY